MLMLKFKRYIFFCFNNIQPYLFYNLVLYEEKKRLKIQRIEFQMNVKLFSREGKYAPLYFIFALLCVTLFIDDHVFHDKL